MAKKETKEVSVKTSVDLPKTLWREAKIRALDEGTDFRRVVIAALESYLKTKPRKGVRNEEQRADVQAGESVVDFVLRTEERQE